MSKDALGNEKYVKSYCGSRHDRESRYGGAQTIKMFLLLAVSTVIAAAVLPSLPAKVMLSAFVLLAALANAARRAPVGCQDEGGFHLLTTKI